MKKRFLICVCLLGVALFGSGVRSVSPAAPEPGGQGRTLSAPVVSNVRASQRGDGSKIIDILYDLEDADNEACTVTLRMKPDYAPGFPMAPTPAFLSGDVGPGIIPGEDKHIIWNAWQEAYQIDGLLSFQVTADDNTIPNNWVYVSSGSFHNGTSLVNVSGFYISPYEITQADWVYTTHYQIPYWINYPDYNSWCPTFGVKWVEALYYCNLRSMAEGLTPVYTYSSYGTNPDYWPSGWWLNAAHTDFSANWSANGYRLPTEAEWEFAAMGGNNSFWYPYIGGGDCNSVSWYQGNGWSQTVAPGQKVPNELGLYDMGGNVWEWCWDIYGDYPAGEQSNPTGPASGPYRSLRGGSAFSPAEQCVTGFRGMMEPLARNRGVGFRVCRNSTLSGAVSDPVLFPSGGTYDLGAAVEITCPGGSSLIRYTTDGSEPSEFHGLYYQVPVMMSSNTPLKAKAFRSGSVYSNTVTGSYLVQNPIPAGFQSIEYGRFYNGAMVITLSPYCIDSRELTQAEFQRVMGYNPSSGAGMGADYPVNNVSWFNAIEYCNRRSILEGLAPCYSYQGHGFDPDNWPAGWNTAQANHHQINYHPQSSGYHIPTEMQWLFAARGATQSHKYTYSGSNSPGAVAWHNTNSGGQTHPVAALAPNERGLYDMSGNVEEWCWDTFDQLAYLDGTDPAGWNIAADRVLRGGSAVEADTNCQPASRDFASPLYTGATLGFRVARNLFACPTVGTPVIPTSWSYPQPVTVPIFCAVPGATIKYTLDGSDPSESNGLVYTVPLMISTTTTLKAMAYKQGYTSSLIAEEQYVIHTINPEGTVLIPGGTFSNGTSNVSVSSFYLGTKEVTQAAYHDVIGTYPAQGVGVGPDYPVYYVSWFDAILYCNARSIREGYGPCYSYAGYGTDPANWPAGWNSDANQGNISVNMAAGGYRLPTEMEWMFAARGGNLTHGFSYSGSNTIAQVAWYDANSGALTHPAGSLAVNELDLYDLSGNVWEWCWDYHAESYPPTSQNDPTGPEAGSYRILRGGSAFSPAGHCTPQFRNNIYPSFANHTLGFRICQSVTSDVNTVSTPFFDPGPGTYYTPQTVSIGCHTPGVTIYYTTDGSQPTPASNVYSGPIGLELSTSFKAIACRVNWNPSAVAEAAYILSGAVATPLVEPASGTYALPQQITMSCSTPGSTIYYTTNGSTPNSSSTPYSGPFTVSATTSIKAVALRPDWTNSALVEREYVILYAPVFSLAAGTYNSVQNVAITCSTAGASIYYTTDGSQPSTSSYLYSAPIEIYKTTTLKAISWRAGYSSAVTEAQYVIMIDIPMVSVGGGSFNNGSSNVSLSGFMISTTEVTQVCYRSVVGINPSDPVYGVGDLRPVQRATWFNAVEYCNRRSGMEGFTPVYAYNNGTDYGTNVDYWPSGWNLDNSNQIYVTANWSANGYRLPTEMEWLFAARGGNLSQNYTWSGSDYIYDVVWFVDNSYYRVHPVATKLPNELGTYDMSGNVWEWCWDYFAGSYPTQDQTNPTGPETGSTRVARGGSIFDDYILCMINNSRSHAFPIDIYPNMGFRVCRSIPGGQ